MRGKDIMDTLEVLKSACFIQELVCLERVGEQSVMKTCYEEVVPLLYLLLVCDLHISLRTETETPTAVVSCLVCI